MSKVDGRSGGLIAGFLLLFLSAVSFPAAVSAESLKVSGTGGAIGGMKLLAEAFRKENPDVAVAIPESMGSSGGIRAAMAGKLDIGLSARPLTPEEQARGARQRPYARTAFVFGANPAVKPSGVTLAELVDIYGGRKSAWGDGTPLRLILRPASDTDTFALGGMSPEMAGAVALAQKREGLTVAMTDQDSADAIERTPGSIGTTTLALAISEKRKIRILSLGGVAPSTAAVRDGTYPYTKTFFLVTGPNPSPAAGRFIRFVLSPAGKTILSRIGCVPLP
jgi:phosphate transport system substrate-binding protein